MFVCCVLHVQYGVSFATSARLTSTRMVTNTTRHGNTPPRDRHTTSRPTHYHPYMGAVGGRRGCLSIVVCLCACSLCVCLIGLMCALGWFCRVAFFVEGNSGRRTVEIRTDTQTTRTLKGHTQTTCEGKEQNKQRGENTQTRLGGRRNSKTQIC